MLALHASLASKHLAAVSRRLAAVATIFLPISFLVGFWGQNFSVVACAGLTVTLLRRRGWN